MVTAYLLFELAMGAARHKQPAILRTRDVDANKMVRSGFPPWCHIQLVSNVHPKLERLGFGEFRKLEYVPLDVHGGLVQGELDQPMLC